MRWQALMMAMATALLAGCGGGDSERAEVTSYLDAVNRIQRAMQPDIEQANQAYRSFTRGRLPARAAVVRLREADIRVRALREQLSALRPPARARGLHREMDAVYGMMSDLTQQTAVLAGYQAGADAALEPVEEHNRDLRRGLRRAGTPKGQASVLGRFAARMRLVVRDLRNLDVPRVLSVSHGDQIRRLSATASLARRLRGALLAGDSPRVARLLERFSGDPGGAPRRRLAREAITDYNDRYQALNRSYRAVIREYNLLDRALG